MKNLVLWLVAVAMLAMVMTQESKAIPKKAIPAANIATHVDAMTAPSPALQAADVRPTNISEQQTAAKQNATSNTVAVALAESWRTLYNLS